MGLRDSREKGCVSDRSESLDVALVSDRREIPLKHESVETGDVNVEMESRVELASGGDVGVPFYVLSVFR
jgi:hypothetical protein